MRQFEVTMTQSPEALIGKALEASAGSSIDFDGDVSSGTFSVMGVHGSYQILDGRAHISVNNKPFLIPWPIVETQIRSFFCG